MDPSTCHPDQPNQCNEISGGDIALKEYSPAHAMELFLTVGAGTGRNQHTPMTAQFFSEKNVLFVTREIAATLKKLTGGQNVRVPFNDEMVQTMVDVAQNNVGLTYVPGAVGILNRVVVEREARVLYNSLLRRKLWIKYYLAQDRMRVFPYGESTRSAKGEEVLSTSGYMLSNPWSRHRACYLRDTEGMCCDQETKEYRAIPGYLQPKKKPPGFERSTEPAYQLGTEPRSSLKCYEDQLRAQLQRD